jgi:hypothetical protein
LTTRDKTNFILFASLLFLGGVYWRYLRFLPGIEKFIFGDYADGLFNLWLLEHNRHFLTCWNLEDYINTRMFFPENRLVFFFSDNLVAPSVVYYFLYLITGNIIVSYNLLAYLFIAFGYSACAYLYYSIFEVSQKHVFPRGEKTLLLYMVPILSYTAAFSDTRMLYTAHFQNYMANFILVGAAFCIRYYYSEKRCFIWCISCTWLILCYSAPYYAVGFSILLLFFWCFLLVSKGCRFVIDVVVKNGGMIAVTILLAAPVLTGYLSVKDSFSNQTEFESSWWHLISPLPETVLFEFLKKLGLPLNFYSHESLSYAGLFLVPFLAIAVFAGLYFVIGFRGKAAYSCLLYVSAVFYIVAYIGCRKVPIISFVAFVILFSLFFGKVISFGKKQFLLAFLFWCVLIFYGIAMGPSRAYLVEGWNPTFWGIFSESILGFRSIRSVGRFGAIGFVFSIALVLHLILEFEKSEWYRRVGKVSIGIFLTSIALNACIDQTRQPYAKSLDFPRLIAGDVERRMFLERKRNILILPLNNLSIIPSYMIYFERIATVEIFNGYSGRFPKTFWDLYTKYADTIDDEGLRFIRNLRGTDLLYDKRYYTQGAFREIERRGVGKKVYENQYFVLYSIVFGE